MIFAFDLDGTLANIEHRLRYINGPKKDWKGFFEACVDDRPITEMVELAGDLETAGHRIEIWSGRSEVVRPQTEEWLNDNFIYYRTLRMRAVGDYRADDIVKGEWLDALDPSQRPRIAFDDRTRVVEMWRSRGIRCCQVAPGDF